ncbi:MAG: RsmE family RNA methyltransferase [Actinomycetota bacterium]|nr:RsmE family RNA methyltransferase [Actinomycetota bacterium]
MESSPFLQSHFASKAHTYEPNCDPSNLSQETLHHLFRVKRLRVGDLVSITDGDGRVALARVEGPLSSESRGKRGSSTSYLVRSGEEYRIISDLPKVEVALAVIDSDKVDLVVTKLTELGVSSILLFMAERSNTTHRLGEGRLRLDRLQKIAIEALSQSRGCFLPEISFVEIDFLFDNDFSFLTFDGKEFDPTARKYVVGPEGGFALSEIPLDVKRCSFAGNVLRSETAAIVASSLALFYV